VHVQRLTSQNPLESVHVSGQVPPHPSEPQQRPAQSGTQFWQEPFSSHTCGSGQDPQSAKPEQPSGQVSHSLSRVEQVFGVHVLEQVQEFSSQSSWVLAQSFGQTPPQSSDPQQRPAQSGSQTPPAPPSVQERSPKIAIARTA
jgi:hypothetical protein